MPVASTVDNMVDVTATKDGGVMKKILTVAPDVAPDQRPMSGDTVFVHYTGRLVSDGSVFDSSRSGSRGPFSFQLDSGQVIKGWDVGVATMAVGEVATYHIRADYGYGERGSPPKIPGGATLEFEVELLDFHGEKVTDDGKVLKSILEKGTGFDSPEMWSDVNVDIRGMRPVSIGSDETVPIRGKPYAMFDTRKGVDVKIGEFSIHKLPTGVESALKKMKEGEVARIHCSSGYLYADDHPASLTSDAPLDHVVYEVRLNSLRNPTKMWELSAVEKLAECGKLKERGTEIFKTGKNFAVALAYYKEVDDGLKHEAKFSKPTKLTMRESDATDEDNESIRLSLLLSARLNAVMCHLKLSEWKEAVDLATVVLTIDPDCVKALFRRGEAYVHLNEHELAVKDFAKVIQLEPGNKAAKNKIVLCRRSLEQEKQKTKKMYANMFEKFAAKDARLQSRTNGVNKNGDELEINEWNNISDDKVNQDPSQLTVSGDVTMNLDLNQELARDSSHARSYSQSVGTTEADNVRQG